MFPGPSPHDERSPPWQAMGVVIVPKSPGPLAFPDRCVVCNEPAEGHRLKRTLAWHPPAVYLLFFLGLLFYIVGALVTRKTAPIELGLCPRHRARRIVGIAIGVAGFVSALVTLVASISESYTPGIAIGSLAIVALPVTGLLLARTLRVRRIDAYSAVVRAGAAFTASLPAAPPGWEGAASGAAAPNAAPGSVYGFPAPYGDGGEYAASPYRYGAAPGYVWAPPVPTGGWRTGTTYGPAVPAAPAPGEAPPSVPASSPAPSEASGTHGWDVEVTPAFAWRIPPVCAGCGSAVTRLQRIDGPRRGGASAWLHVGMCGMCAARHAARWKAHVLVLVASAGVGFGFAIAEASVDPFLPWVLFVLPIAGALIGAFVSRFALERTIARAHELVAFRFARIRGPGPRAILWCADRGFATGFAAANGFGVTPASRRPRLPVEASLVVGLLLALGAGAVAWAVQWPRVVVDNATGKPIAIWVDGERLFTVAPNDDGSTSATVRIPRGGRKLAYGPSDAVKPVSTLAVQIEGDGRHLFNPGRLACHWREITPYAIDPTKAHKDPSIPWDLHGPIDREEFMTIDDVDHWFEPTPDEIDMRGRHYRTAIVRGEVCTELAQARCTDELLDVLVDCERQSPDPDDLDKCRTDAVDRCAEGTMDL